MKDTPQVSLVVPVHNVREYLDACVASILDQTEPDIEVLLVDDGSSDGSEAMCDEWGRRDNRVRVIHQPQQGSSVARNRGIDEARGAYVTFVDADDLVAPHLVSGLTRVALSAGADITLGEIVPFAAPGQPTFTLGTTTTTSSAADELLQIICVRPQWGPMAKLFRRDLFEGGPRFPVGLLHQDLAFMPRMFHEATTCARTDAGVYGYRHRPGSVSDNVRRVSFSTDLITILRDNIEFARRTAPPEQFAEFLVTYLLHASKHVERIEAGEAWDRNADFLSAYQSFARDYAREMARVPGMGRAYRSLWLLSAGSPAAFARVWRTAVLLKSRGLALRRRATAQTPRRG
ncbi:glycosyltransferase family 2 protein [Knoellia sp. Soil729]|uniref:glycosyltransferase family 2 protein n=1 Tax=Knoellia sp. Soil729 TaxID=1736394 RepID=UPI0006F3871D|nr:glycosyltransferase [Knoellia sp. Soil729]KRE43463.1 hypothetical protein ASG74_01005 [Knoellia sp. Soil729]